MIGGVFKQAAGYVLAKVGIGTAKLPFKAAATAIGSPVLTTAAAATVDHYAFDGKGRGWVMGQGADMANNFVSAAVDKAADRVGLGSESGLAGLIKDNWGIIGTGIAAMGAMFTGHGFLGKIAMYATIGMALYKGIKGLLSGEFGESVGETFNLDADPSTMLEGFEKQAVGFITPPAGSTPAPTSGLMPHGPRM